MPPKNINIRDLVTSQECSLGVEDRHLISEIINIVMREFGLTSGNRLLMKKDEALNPRQTVGDAGLNDGDWLIIAPNPVGGAILPESTWRLRIDNEIKLIEEADFYRAEFSDHGTPITRTITIYLFDAPAYKKLTGSPDPLLSRKHTLHIGLERGFPETPPVVRFTSAIFHPNVYPGGRVCIAMLNSWDPSYNIIELIKAIEALLWNPNLRSPANHDAARFYHGHPVVRPDRPWDIPPIRVRRISPRITGPARDTSPPRINRR